MKDKKQEQYLKNLKSRKEILNEDDVIDTNLEKRSEARIESIRADFFNEQYNYHLALKKRSHDSVIDVQFDFIDEKYIEMLDYLSNDGFIVSNVSKNDNDFSIQLLNSEFELIFEANKYTLVVLYVISCISKNDFEIIFTNNFVFNIDNNTTIKYKDISTCGKKLKCYINGIKINKLVDIDLREILRMRFLNKEYIENGLSVPRNLNKMSLLDIITKSKFEFMYTISELLSDVCCLKFDIDFESINNYKETKHNNVFIDELIDYELLYISEYNFEGNKFEISQFKHRLNSDVEYYNHIIKSKIEDESIKKYLKEIK